MSRQRIHETNKKYWDQTADDWFGVTALFKAGFVIEEMVEETDSETRTLTGAMSDRSRKAQRLPLSFAFKARKR